MNTIVRHINRFVLDPNNYRFRDSPGYLPVSEDKVENPKIQQRTFNLLVGKNHEQISDLVDSMKENGFIPVDQIQVKALSSDNYLVLEGNRRIATLKYLYNEFKRGNDVGKLTEKSFRSVEVVLNPDEDLAGHLIVMGLKHINGNRKWKAVNQAQLIQDLIVNHGKSEDEVCRSLGITKQALRRARRTLAFINRYKDSDYGDQFSSGMFSIFEEAISKRNMKEWLQWNDELLMPQNAGNEERFFSWVSYDEVNEGEGDDIHIVKKEPIITKYTQVRELNNFILDEKAVAHMEHSRSITQGYSFSEAVAESKFKNALSNLQSNAQALFNFSEFMGQTDLDTVAAVRDKIARLIPENGSRVRYGDEIRPHYLFRFTEKHFSALYIERYNRLFDLKLKAINRVNIIAGINNSGKTSLLEAIYSLAQLNNIKAYLDIVRYRGKFYQGLNTQWVARHLGDSMKANGVFNERPVYWELRQEETDDDIDKTQYLSSIVLQAQVEQEAYESTAHLFQEKDSTLYYREIFALCRSAFTSPYQHNYHLLRLAHAHAVREKVIGDILRFLREKVDPMLQDIELVEIAGESRFYVSAQNHDQSVDITQYGEGVQRIFEIALLTAYCSNGVLCIDEFESAIHKDLLTSFTMFLQDLAERFNVQIFLSTHSKECIDAFVENDFKNDQITAYVLRVDEQGNIKAKYLEGTRLERLVDNMNIDIRV